MNHHINIPARGWKKYVAAFLCLQISIYGCTTAGNALKSTGEMHSQSGLQDTAGEFSIAVIPDTQYYVASMNGGSSDMFTAQTQWIVKNADKEKIAYVIHLGDIAQTGDKQPQEWANAAQAMYLLDQPQPGYPQGIPYGLTVGNHDQSKSQYPLSGKTENFNKYFGIAHFKKKKYYGGHYSNNNDSHYDLFSAGGTDFITIYVEYDSYDEDQENMNSWVCSILEKYASRKAIIVSHYLISNNAKAGTNEKGFPHFGKQGKHLYDRIERYHNVFMMLCGHVGENGEGYRRDGYAGNIVQTFMSDYQGRKNGGDGLMRLMKFSKDKDLISVSTFSPFTGKEEKDEDSEFTTPWLHGTNVARTFDFDNDQLTDAAFFKNGHWAINGSADVHFGEAGDIPAAADYNGDGKAEPAVYRPSTGTFYFKEGQPVKLGQAGDLPVPGDYDGDRYADAAVFRPSTNTWFINGGKPIKHGGKGSIAVPADYDGDGLTDIAVFQPATSIWQVYGLGNVPLGKRGDIPVPADYDGDGKAEMAVYRPSTGEWIIDKMKQAVQLGGKPGDIPVPGNYFKDGKAYAAILRNKTILLQDRTIALTDVTDPADILNLPYAIRRVFFQDKDQSGATK